MLCSESELNLSDRVMDNKLNNKEVEKVISKANQKNN